MKTRMLPITVVLISASLLMGCASMIGFAVGYSSDESSKSKTRIASAITLEPDIMLTAVLKDSTKYFGQYRGYCGSELSMIVDSSGRQSLNLPYYSEPVAAIDTLGGKSQYLFNGFFYHQDGNNWIPYMFLSEPKNLLVKRIGVQSLKELIRNDGTKITQNQIQSFFAGQNAPLSSCILIRDSNLTNPISLEKIDHLETPLHKGAAMRGLLYGAIIDALFCASLYVITLSNWHTD